MVVWVIHFRCRLCCVGKHAFRRWFSVGCYFAARRCEVVPLCSLSSAFRGVGSETLVGHPAADVRKATAVRSHGGRARRAPHRFFKHQTPARHNISVAVPGSHDAHCKLQVPRPFLERRCASPFLCAHDLLRRSAVFLFVFVFCSFEFGLAFFLRTC